METALLDDGNGGQNEVDGECTEANMPGPVLDANAEGPPAVKAAQADSEGSGPPSSARNGRSGIRKKRVSRQFRTVQDTGLALERMMQLWLQGEMSDDALRLSATVLRTISTMLPKEGSGAGGLVSRSLADRVRENPALADDLAPLLTEDQLREILGLPPSDK